MFSKTHILLWFQFCSSILPITQKNSAYNSDNDCGLSLFTNRNENFPTMQNNSQLSSLLVELIRNNKLIYVYVVTTCSAY